MLENAPSGWVLLAGDMNGGGGCFLTPERTYVVQGLLVLNEVNRELVASGKEKIAEGESVVEVPQALIHQVTAVMRFIESRKASELRWVAVGHRGPDEVWQLAPNLQAEALRGI